MNKQSSTTANSCKRGTRSAAESVEGAALALERVDDVHGGDGLAAGVLRVGDGVADDVLEEDLEHAAGLLVDEPGDALHAAPPRQPPDRRLGDALDVVAEHLAVALGAALAQPLAALAAPRHRRSRRGGRLCCREGFGGVFEFAGGGCCGGAADLGWIYRGGFGRGARGSWGNFAWGFRREGRISGDDRFVGRARSRRRIEVGGWDGLWRLLPRITEVDRSIRGVRFADVGCDLMVEDSLPGDGADR
jgi:hypothetical protein